ncbi:MAG: hypothetical protein ACJA1O_001643 [Spirosomataceae bacterium]|jgi:hypothetical protein
MKIHFCLSLIIGLTFAFHKAEAQVKYKQHEFDIIGDIRILKNSNIYGIRASYPIFNLKPSGGKYSFPIQLYTGADYSTNAAWGYSIGLRVLYWRRSLEQTIYAAQNVHFRTKSTFVESFDKEEYITAFGAGYKLKPDVGIEYLIGGNDYTAGFIHNFAVIKTIHFQTTKRLRRKTKLQDCPPDQRQ